MHSTGKKNFLLSPLLKKLSSLVERIASNIVFGIADRTEEKLDHNFQFGF